MSVGVITAVGHRLEADLVAGLEGAPAVTVVRRCADLAELLSAGAAGVAEVAVVSPDLRGLDRDALRHLAGHGVRVAALVAPQDEDGERRVRQLGVATLVRPGEDATRTAQILAALGSGQTSWLGGAGFAAEGREAPGATGSDGLDQAGLVQLGRGLLGQDPLAMRPLAPRPPGPDPGDPDPGQDGPHGIRPAPVTAVWGPTGAPGRTTVAITLAAQLAASGVNTLLVDLDTWGSSVAQALALVDEAPGVAAAGRASEQGTLDLPALARVSPVVAPGLRVLTGLPRPARWPEVRRAAVENILDVARLLVAHVVLDCGFAIEDDEELSYDTAAPRRNAATLAALERADSLLLVGAADPVGLQRLVRAVQDVAVLPSPTPVVVVNKVRSAVAGPHPERAVEEVLGRFAGITEPHLLPWAPQECDAALLAGRSLLEEAPDAAITRALGALAERVRPSPARTGARRARRVARVPFRR